MVAVRLATMDDAEIIARQTSTVQQLHKDALPDIFKPPSAALFPPQKLAALLQDRDAVVAVAEIDGRVVGHIYAAVVSSAENAFKQASAHMHIHQIGVDDAVRREGVGTALVGFIREQTLARGLSAMHVDHWAFNAHAAGFFEACGFRPMKIVMHQTLKD